jgi:hypothetical protein
MTFQAAAHTLVCRCPGLLSQIVSASIDGFVE